MRSSAIHILLVAVLLAGSKLHAQQATVVKATVDKNRIMIGEPITLSLEATIPINEAVRFFEIDTIPHFEILETPAIDSSGNLRQTLLKQSLTLTSFDSGKWVIPSLVLTEGIQTDSIVIDVVFSEFNPDAPYHPIKEVIPVEIAEKKKSEWWWYAAGAGLVLIIGLVYLLTRKRKPAVVVEEKRITPYEQAMQELERLKQPGIEDKAFFAGISDTLRLYIFQRKGIEWRHLITDDLIRELRSIGLGEDLNRGLAQTLLLGDFVKFAKYHASADEKAFGFATVKDSIEKIEATERMRETAERQNVNRES